MPDTLSDERESKLAALRALGIDPYRGVMADTSPVADVLEAFCEDGDPVQAVAAGRIVGGIRRHGKAAFFHVQDRTGRIQVYVRKDRLGDAGFEVFGLLDVGDIVGVAGPLQKTRTGEITVFADRLVPLCKALLPLPEKWHGLKDVETRYRQRSLDLISNPDVLQRFLVRTQIIAGLRRFLTDRGFVEVETPMMQSIPGGAAARPFITHHNALDIDLYLRVSPELYLKRLLVGGLERVFEINRNFRNEGISPKRSPEFTMLEFYQAYSNYTELMDLTEEMIVGLVAAVEPSLTLPFNDETIDYARPWVRKTYGALLEEHAGVAVADIAGARRKADELGIETDGLRDCDIVNEVFEATAEPTLVQPTFVYDYPAELCPLTQRKADNPGIAERFEFYIGRMEVGNAYSELTDPLVQEQLFRDQAGEEESMVGVLDQGFLTAMRHGMPPAGGEGIGIDRLVMLLTNKRSIRDVVLFPLLRPS